MNTDQPRSVFIDPCSSVFIGGFKKIVSKKTRNSGVDYELHENSLADDLLFDRITGSTGFESFAGYFDRITGSTGFEEL